MDEQFNWYKKPTGTQRYTTLPCVQADQIYILIECKLMWLFFIFFYFYNFLLFSFSSFKFNHSSANKKHGCIFSAKEQWMCGRGYRGRMSLVLFHWWTILWPLSVSR